MSERCMGSDRGRRPLLGALIVIAMLFPAACQVRQTHRALREEPAIEATVVTIQTTIQPQNRTFTHALVIGSDKARSGDEVDRWRLFDFKNSNVTFVDEVTKTYRTESLPSLLAAAQKTASQPLPAGVPRVAVTRTSALRMMQGAEAEQILMRAGTYAREIWIARHPAIPPQLFSMMLVSAPPSSTLSAMTKSANDALLASDGFPLADHSEISYDDKKLTVDHNVVRIERKNVPQSWLTISPGYRDVTPPPSPPPSPAAKRPRAKK
jgi:hypothetical protein